jgi:MFS family permease
VTKRGSLWRHQDFLKLWTGETISVFGSSISQLAIPLVAISTLGATTFEVGALNAVETAPFLLVALWAGVFVDRRKRRGVLISADIGRALALASIPIVFWLGGMDHDNRLSGLAQLYAVALVSGILTVFFDVAYQSYLPSLVDRDQLAEGNSKLTTTEAAAQLAGPGAAGVLIHLLKAPVAIVVDAASFLVSAFAVMLIRKPEPEVEIPEGGHNSVRSDIGEGLRYVTRHPMLKKIAACTGTSNLGNSMTQAVLVVFLVRELHYSPQLLGLVFSLGSVGFLLGSVITARVTEWFGLGRTIIASSGLAGMAALVLPFVPGDNKAISAPLVVASSIVVGIGVPIYNIGQVSLRQAITPIRLQGRMNASMRFIVWGTMPLGGLIGGALGGPLGLRTTMLIGAVINASCFLWVLFSPVRSLKEIPQVEEPSGTEAIDVAEDEHPPTGAAPLS